MNAAKTLQNRIRGWLPNKPNLSFPTTTKPQKTGNHKTKLPIGGILTFCFFTVMSVGYLVEGNAMGLLFVWFACIIGVGFALDILVSHGREFNPKLVMGVLFGVISLGGVLVNLIVFSLPSSGIVRVLSLTMLAVFHVPLLIAVVAYVWGKKDLSKKLINWFAFRRA
jgi:hypothetical protein